jgi:hypothetical protein
MYGKLMLLVYACKCCSFYFSTVFCMQFPYNTHVNGLPTVTVAEDLYVTDNTENYLALNVWCTLWLDNTLYTKCMYVCMYVCTYVCMQSFHDVWQRLSTLDLQRTLSSQSTSRRPHSSIDPSTPSFHLFLASHFSFFQQESKFFT